MNGISFDTITSGQNYTKDGKRSFDEMVQVSKEGIMIRSIVAHKFNRNWSQLETKIEECDDPTFNFTDSHRATIFLAKANIQYCKYGNYEAAMENFTIAEQYGFDRGSRVGKRLEEEKEKCNIEQGKQSEFLEKMESYFSEENHKKILEGMEEYFSNCLFIDYQKKAHLFYLFAVSLVKQEKYHLARHIIQLGLNCETIEEKENKNFQDLEKEIPYENKDKTKLLPFPYFILRKPKRISKEETYQNILRVINHNNDLKKELERFLYYDPELDAEDKGLFYALLALLCLKKQTTEMRQAACNIINSCLISFLKDSVTHFRFTIIKKQIENLPFLQDLLANLKKEALYVLDQLEEKRKASLNPGIEKI